MTTPRPTIVYDASCAFCRRWIARWRTRTGDAVDYRPFQEPGLLDRLGIPAADARRAVQLVLPDGRRREGADAVASALATAPGRRLATAGRLPGVRGIAGWLYELVARNRGLAARADSVLFGTSTDPTDTAIVRRLFSRALGGVHLVAFTSLRAQVLGLYGERGVTPIASWLELVGSHEPWQERLRLIPSIFWADASDEALLHACRAGQVVSAMSLLGIAPRLTALASWALYLSFVSAGREFLSFQWDALLLETGLKAAVIAPPRELETPPWTATAMMRALAFRLYFESGFAKLASGDPSWRSSTACSYHYATQPLPTRLGWWANQLPHGFQRMSTFAALAIEVGAPFLALAPRRLRRAAFVALAGLQAAIAATGNYGFFNLLTVVNSMWLLDDGALPKRLRGMFGTPRRAPWWRRLAMGLAAVPLIVAAAGEMYSRLSHRPGPTWLRRIRHALAPLRAVNPYGLFAVMTTERPEIVVEGSHDGATWREYRFRYKPSAVDAPPPFVAPHQPRLDWQMWFAAMTPPPPWFVTFLVRLLEAEPTVLALLDGDPFPDGAPVFVRALLYRYHMTDRAERRSTGAWWRRELVGTYMPPIALTRSGGPRIGARSGSALR